MTLKTLKPKASNSLILDDEFLEYCKLNNIEDVEKFAHEVFQKGFTIVKYGEIPKVNLKTQTKIVQSEVKQVETSLTVEQTKPKIVVPKNLEKDLIKVIEKEIKKDDIYDE